MQAKTQVNFYRLLMTPLQRKILIQEKAFYGAFLKQNYRAIFLEYKQTLKYLAFYEDQDDP